MLKGEVFEKRTYEDRYMLWIYIYRKERKTKDFDRKEKHNPAR